jgi:hypothetical protein
MMADDGGRPQIALSAVGLGVRLADKAPHNDVDALAPADVVNPGSGMSVAPHDPAALPPRRRPASLGGTGRHPVWEIDAADLGPDLGFVQDSRTHGVIGPARPMAIADYLTALTATRDRWRLHTT